MDIDRFCKILDLLGFKTSDNVRFLLSIDKRLIIVIEPSHWSHPDLVKLPKDVMYVDFSYIDDRIIYASYPLNDIKISDILLEIEKFIKIDLDLKRDILIESIL